MPLVLWFVVGICTSLPSTEEVVTSSVFFTEQAAQEELYKETHGDIISANCKYDIYKGTPEEEKSQ